MKTIKRIMWIVALVGVAVFAAGVTLIVQSIGWTPTIGLTLCLAGVLIIVGVLPLLFWNLIGKFLAVFINDLNRALEEARKNAKAEAAMDVTSERVDRSEESLVVITRSPVTGEHAPL